MPIFWYGIKLCPGLFLLKKTVTAERLIITLYDKNFCFVKNFLLGL